MTPLLLILVLTVLQASPAKPQAKIPSELVQLRNEFVKATNEYKQSLMRLKTFSEQDVVRVEEKLGLSRKLASENLLSQPVVEDYQAELKRAQAKLVEVNNQIANADEEIKRAPDDAKLASEYKEAVAQRRRERRPRCANWTLTAYRRETAKTIEVGFRFVCR
jgi:predicted  nucleic acid-binding Zn-ribbon protein